MSGKKGEHNRSEGVKRPYHPPQLHVYGDINKVTGARIFNFFTPGDGRSLDIGRIILYWRS